MAYSYAACRRGECVGSLSIIASIIAIIGGWCLIGMLLDINNRMPSASSKNLVEYYPPWVGVAMQHLDCFANSTNCFEFVDEPVPFMPSFTNLGRTYNINPILGYNGIGLILPSVLLTVFGLFAVHLPDSPGHDSEFCVGIFVQLLWFLWFIGLAATSLWFCLLDTTIEPTHNVSWYSGMDTFTFISDSPFPNTVCVKVTTDEFACTGRTDNFFQLTPGFLNILTQLGITTTYLCETSIPVNLVCSIVIPIIIIYYAAWIQYELQKRYGCEFKSNVL